MQIIIPLPLKGEYSQYCSSSLRLIFVLFRFFFALHWYFKSKDELSFLPQSLAEHCEQSALSHYTSPTTQQFGSLRSILASILSQSWVDCPDKQERLKHATNMNKIKVKPVTVKFAVFKYMLILVISENWITDSWHLSRVINIYL